MISPVPSQRVAFLALSKPGEQLVKVHVRHPAC
jgi:hypothetical protein